MESSGLFEYEVSMVNYVNTDKFTSDCNEIHIRTNVPEIPLPNFEPYFLNNSLFLWGYPALFGITPIPPFVFVRGNFGEMCRQQFNMKVTPPLFDRPHSSIYIAVRKTYKRHDKVRNFLRMIS